MTGRLLLAGLCLLVAAAPLPFGSVEAAPSALLSSSCLVLAAVWTAARRAEGRPALPRKEPLLAAGLLLAAVGALQIAPLPRGALLLASPRALEIRDAYEPAPSAGGAPSPAALEPAGWRPLSLYPWATRQSTLRLLAFLAAALIAADLASHGRRRRVLAGALAATGGFQAIYGLAEHLSGRQHIFGYAKRWYADVATGTFINRNHFAGLLEMSLPMAIALAAAAASRIGTARPAGGDPAASGRRLFAASALGLLALVIATALACSRSRMGIASALAGLAVVGLHAGRRRGGLPFAAAGLAVTGAAALLLTRGAGAPILERFAAAADDLSSGPGRGAIWSQAVAMAAAFPVAGVGLGAFQHVFPLFRTSGEGVAVAHAHGDYLEWAAETGALGGLAALAGAFVVLRSVWAASSRPAGPVGLAAAAGLVALALHSITDFNLAIPSNALAAAVLLGILVGSRRPSGTRAAPSPAARPRGRPPAAAAAALALALLASAPLLPAPLRAGDAGRLSAAAREKGRAATEDLEALAAASARGAPPSPEAVRYVERRLDEAIALQTEAGRILPTASSGRLLLGHLRAGLCAAAALRGGLEDGCLSGAAAEYRAALELNPMSVTTLVQIARFYEGAFDALDGDLRSEAGSVIERAGRTGRPAAGAR